MTLEIKKRDTRDPFEASKLRYAISPSYPKEEKKMKEFMEGLQNAGITEEDFTRHLGVLLDGNNIKQDTNELQQAVIFLQFLYDSAAKIVSQKKEG